MAATEPLYLRLAPGLKDRIVAAARRDGVSANEWAQETLRRALASGAGGSVSAGLAVSSAPVASDGALAETGTAEVKQVRSAAMDAPSPVSPPVSASASPFVPDALKPKADTTPAEVARSVPGVTTGGDLRKSQVTPHLKSEQAGRKK